jgi:hypothetical protein
MAGLSNGLNVSSGKKLYHRIGQNINEFIRIDSISNFAKAGYTLLWWTERHEIS